MMPNITTPSGHVSAYGFACGYVERKGHAKLWREHGVYHILVPGWKKDPSQYWRTVRTLREARPILAKLGRLQSIFPETP